MPRRRLPRVFYIIFIIHRWEDTFSFAYLLDFALFSCELVTLCGSQRFFYLPIVIEILINPLPLWLSRNRLEPIPLQILILFLIRIANTIIEYNIINDLPILWCHSHHITSIYILLKTLQCHKVLPHMSLLLKLLYPGIRFLDRRLPRQCIPTLFIHWPWPLRRCSFPFLAWLLQHWIVQLVILIHVFVVVAAASSLLGVLLLVSFVLVCVDSLFYLLVDVTVSPSGVFL